MSEKLRWTRSLPFPGHATIVAYLALFVALGGGAYAVSSKLTLATVSACYAKGSGSLRIPARGRCAHGERKLTWNQQGPQGLPGATGTQGPGGPRGATGTVDTSSFYTKEQSNALYLPIGGSASNASALGGQPASAFAPANLFGKSIAIEEGTVSSSGCQVGEILLTASKIIPQGTVPAQGQLEQIASNTTLFNLLGTSYGGDGKTTFALPDLRGAEPKGRGPAGVNYVICLFGIYP